MIETNGERFNAVATLVAHTADRYIDILLTEHGSYRQWIEAVGRPMMPFLTSQEFSVLTAHADRVEIEVGEEKTLVEVEARNYIARAHRILRWAGCGPWDFHQSLVHMKKASSLLHGPGINMFAQFSRYQVMEVLGVHAYAVHVAYSRPTVW